MSAILVRVGISVVAVAAGVIIYFLTRERERPNSFSNERPEAFKTDESKICCICLEEYSGLTGKAEILPCNHKFHRSCLIRLFMHTERPSCPVCRRSVSASFCQRKRLSRE